MPNLHIEGLIYGKPFIELDGCSYINSSTGFSAKVDYSGKGWLSGKKNTFNASLYPTDKQKEVLYTAEGQWTDSFTIKTGHGGAGSALKKATSHNEPVDSYNAKTTKTTPLTVPSIEQQDPYESHRAWQHVKAAIEKGDLDTVHVEKSKIEQAQRELRKKEQADGKAWTRRFFNRSEKDDVFDTLAKPLGAVIDADKTGGVWRFDESKKANAHQRENKEDRGMGAVIDEPPPSEAPQQS